ncbi:efflux RND transporter periplasmic adaptor subunit [Sphingobium olei]|jgi:RND family efflux transporter MFP subunit|uniref:Efflux RND transporter periplasmic adaptor subunit n=1 Tax=Sphingobium olei TaxID=420955 RepID=A0ABW3NVQ4_9SPHN
MPETSSKRRFLIGSGAALALVAVVGGGIAARYNAEAEEAAIARDNALPTVSVIRATVAKGGNIGLPGELSALNEAEINARTSGYVSRWLVDIGQTVRKGQLLAVLDAPELEQQLAQARADLKSAVANRDLARTTAERWRTLRGKDAVSTQEADEKQGQYAATAARAEAARANVRRLEALGGFTRIVAPFSGVITSRNVQLGALVTTGAGGKPLFTIADTTSMRVYVRVPQNVIGQLNPGITADVTVPDRPGQSFGATLVRTARSVDRASGTMLAEFRIAQPSDALVPGSFATIDLGLRAAPGTIELPATSLITNAKGTQVAIADPQGRVSLRPVKVGRDTGRSVTILSGVRENDRVIATPPDAIEAGDRVRIVAQRPSEKPNAS